MTNNQQISPEVITNLINSYFNEIKALNPEAWLQLFAEDAIVFDPVGNPPSQVHQDYQQFFALISNFFEKLDFKQDYLMICGQQAALKWTMEVEAKNGRQTITEGISIFIVNDQGKIQQISAYWDEKAMMEQLKG